MDDALPLEPTPPPDSTPGEAAPSPEAASAPELDGAPSPDAAATPPAEGDVLARLREEYWDALQVAEDLDPGIAPSSFLGLHLGDSAFAVPLNHCRSVLRLPRLARVPHAPAWLRGVLSLRGEILPVLDLRPLLALPGVDLGERPRVVVVQAGPLAAGLVADRIDEVWELPGPPPAAPRGAVVVDIPDAQGRLLLVEALLEDAYVRLGKEVP